MGADIPTAFDWYSHNAWQCELKHEVAPYGVLRSNAWNYVKGIHLGRELTKGIF